MATATHHPTSSISDGWPNATDSPHYLSVDDDWSLHDNRTVSSLTATTVTDEYGFDGTQCSSIPDNAVITNVRVICSFTGAQITKYPWLKFKFKVSGGEVSASPQLNANTFAFVVGYYDFSAPGFTVANLKSGDVSIQMIGAGEITESQYPFEYF